VSSHQTSLHQFFCSDRPSRPSTRSEPADFQAETWVNPPFLAQPTIDQVLANLFKPTGNTARYEAVICNGATSSEGSAHIPEQAPGGTGHIDLTKNNVQRLEESNVLTPGHAVITLEDSPRAKSKRPVHTVIHGSLQIETSQ
jgi:hypothetical protein